MGIQCLNVSSPPPSIIESVPAIAPVSPPLTGASNMAMPSLVSLPPGGLLHREFVHSASFVSHRLSRQQPAVEPIGALLRHDPDRPLHSTYPASDQRAEV